MPGLTIFDFGDMVRTAAATADEDEPDTSKMSLDIELFGELVKGFTEQTVSFLTKVEKNHLAFACQVIILEQALRFLTDYIEGDVYYKIHRALHNLDRCRTQLKLVQSITEQQKQMEKIVKMYY
jgi:hypothetical protein